MYVERNVVEIRNKVPHKIARYGGRYQEKDLVPLRDGELYVNPKTGLLCKNGQHKSYQDTYGKAVYCSNKRQLNKKEKKRLGIK